MRYTCCLLQRPWPTISWCRTNERPAHSDSLVSTSVHYLHSSLWKIIKKNRLFGEKIHPLFIWSLRPFWQQTIWLVKTGKAQVPLTSLTTAQFCLNVPLRRDSLTVMHRLWTWKLNQMSPSLILLFTAFLTVISEMKWNGPIVHLQYKNKQQEHFDFARQPCVFLKC